MRKIGVYIARHHIGLLALVIALGGTSYAAVNLPAGSVGARQLRNGAVSSVKLRNGAVSASKIKVYSLLGKDFKRGQLKAGPRGRTGPAGSAGQIGAQGPAGVSGPQGRPGLTAAAFVSTTDSISIISNGFVPVVSLSTPSTPLHTTSTGKLKVDFPAQILVQATATISSTAPQSIHSGECDVGLTDAQGNRTLDGTVGNVVFFNQVPGDNVISVTGAIDEPAGTYDATLYCVGDQSEAYESTLTAFAGAT